MSEMNLLSTFARNEFFPLSYKNDREGVSSITKVVAQFNALFYREKIFHNVQKQKQFKTKMFSRRQDTSRTFVMSSFNEKSNKFLFKSL